MGELNTPASSSENATGLIIALLYCNYRTNTRVGQSALCNPLQGPRSDLSEAGKPRISLLQAFHISQSRFNRKRAPVAMTEKLVLVSY